MATYGVCGTIAAGWACLAIEADSAEEAMAKASAAAGDLGVCHQCGAVNDPEVVSITVTNENDENDTLTEGQS